MRITPSISLSWTIEREIDSEECREEEDPQPEDPDPPNPITPDLPEPIHINNCDKKLYGWHLLEFQELTYNENGNGSISGTFTSGIHKGKSVSGSPYNSFSESYKAGIGGSGSRTGIYYKPNGYGGYLFDENGALIPANYSPYSDDENYGDKWLEPRRTKIWLYNPSKEPSFIRTVQSSNKDGKIYTYVQERTYICYEKAAMFNEFSLTKRSEGVIPDYFYMVRAQYWWNNGGVTLSSKSNEFRGTFYPDYTNVYTTNSVSKFKTNLYQPEEITPPDPLPEIGYPKMSKKCCSDPKLMKMVKEIYDVLDPKKIKKSSIPRRFLAIDGEGTEKLKTYNEIFQALFLMLDKQGYIPFSVKKETADGDEIGLDFKHQSQALHAIIGHLINMDQDTQETEQIKQLDRKYGEVTARLALAICQILSTSIHTNEMCYAILQFLGFKTTDSYDNVPTSLDPISLKEFSDIDIDTESNPDEFNDRIMAILFSDSELKVPAIKMSDQKTLQTALLELKLLLTKPVQTTK